MFYLMISAAVALLALAMAESSESEMFSDEELTNFDSVFDIQALNDIFDESTSETGSPLVPSTTRTAVKSSTFPAQSSKSSTSAGAQKVKDFVSTTTEYSSTAILNSMFIDETTYPDRECHTSSPLPVSTPRSNPAKGKTAPTTRHTSLTYLSNPSSPSESAHYTNPPYPHLPQTNPQHSQTLHYANPAINPTESSTNIPRAPLPRFTMPRFVNSRYFAPLPSAPQPDDELPRDQARPLLTSCAADSINFHSSLELVGDLLGVIVKIVKSLC